MDRFEVARGLAHANQSRKLLQIYRNPLPAAAWVVEIERRIAAREAGEATARPLHDAIDDIRATLAASQTSNAR